jgi:protein involved in polysaccharide export with SLBB domain
MNALDDKIGLEDGDIISFRVVEDRDQAVTRVVTDDGEADFPYIGRLKVEGKTCYEVAKELKKLLEVDYYNQATVIIGLDTIAGEDRSKSRDLVWLAGEVRSEGPQELITRQPMTVSQIILKSGGFNTDANERNVRLFHRGATPGSHAAGEGQVIDVKAVLDGKSTDDPLVQPGDFIIVRKRILNF